MKVALAIALLCLAAAQRQVTLKPDSTGESAGCKPGETVAFRIESNPTTGYSWFFVPPNSATASLQNDFTGTYIPPDSQLMGAPGIQEFQVKCSEQARSNDAYQFTLIKKRPWEDKSLRTKVVTLTVE